MRWMWGVLHASFRGGEGNPEVEGFLWDVAGVGGCLLGEGYQGSERADPAQFAPSYGGRPTTEQLHLRVVSF